MFKAKPLTIRNILLMQNIVQCALL